MNKNKISPILINEVTSLSKNEKSVLILSNNFIKTKNFLKENNFNYTPYRFAGCFSVIADNEDIKHLSSLDNITYISNNAKVLTLNKESDFLNLNKITENKFYGQGQTICFIDTGIHPHLDFILPHNKIIKFVDFINKNSKPYDDNGHGTFTAGIACGNGILKTKNRGVAPLCNIVSIKALTEDGSSNSNNILDAMQWIFENHKVYNISVVCMSFGADTLEKSDPLSKGAEALWNIGLTVVAAAGNSGPKKNSIKSPGCNPNIITVGALDISSMQTAEFSSRGPTIYGHKPDLLAPAVDIVSCNNKSLPYTLMSGTSVATPIIAGVCAILKSKYPKITNNQIKKLLINNCKKITGDIDIEGAGYLCF